MRYTLINVNFGLFVTTGIHTQELELKLLKLMDCTGRLTDLYERVPILTAIRQSDAAIAPHSEQQQDKELT